MSCISSSKIDHSAAPVILYPSLLFTDANNVAVSLFGIDKVSCEILSV